VGGWVTDEELQEFAKKQQPYERTEAEIQALIDKRKRQQVGVTIVNAPTRAVSMPKDAAERKRSPVASGVLDYFPDALIEVARVSFEGNEQHNPGQRLHWDRSKSTDEADALIRHFLERGLRDVDGMRHSAKMAWRALALLQKEIEAERNDPTK
jgi:hypothetical protein